MKLMLGLALSLLVTGAVTGEDMDQRNRAEQLMNRALLASKLTKPLNIRTDVTFSATGNDGIATAGNYVRVRSADHALREDFVLGDYRMSRIQEQGRVATHGQWVDIPYTLRKVMEFVPYLPIRFDSTDVINSINETKMNGKSAVCIQFVTVRGEDRNPGDVCLAKDNATVIEWHDRDHSFEALEYRSVQGALLPSHFIYREGEKLLIDASVRWTLLDARPDDAFIAPEDWQQAFYCKAFSMPVLKSGPQPPPAPDRRRRPCPYRRPTDHNSVMSPNRLTAVLVNTCIILPVDLHKIAAWKLFVHQARSSCQSDFCV